MSSPNNTSDDSQSQASASTSSSCPFSDEFPQLLDKHLDHLKASAISIDCIKERGYESVLGKKRLADLGFSKAQQRTPGLLCPGWGVDGQQIGCQYRPDHPRVDGRDRTIKYETPKGASNHVDCPPRCQKQLADPSIPLYVTEGAKKGDCLATQGLCVIDISGIWNWKSKNELKGVTISADFLGRVAWKYLIKDAALHKFDVLLVWKIDRAFRSVIHAANTLNMLRGYRVGFRSYTEPSIDTTTPHGEFIFNIMAAVAALERQTISQRVRAGMDYAKQHGTKSGNKIGRKRYDVPFAIVCKAL